MTNDEGCVAATLHSSVGWTLPLQLQHDVTPLKGDGEQSEPKSEAARNQCFLVSKTLPVRGRWILGFEKKMPFTASSPDRRIRDVEQ